MFDTIFTNTVTDTVNAINVQGAILSILLAIALGLIICMAYIFVTRDMERSSSFLLSLIILPAIVSVVILLIGNNIARAFSMAGAFTLVRFRSAPGDSKDITFVFLALAVGLGCGLGFLTFAGVVTVMLSLIIVLFYKFSFSNIKIKRRQLKITIPEDMNFEGAFDDLFQKYTTKFDLERVKTTNMGTLFELTYGIHMKEGCNQKEFIDELRCRNGNLNISLSILDNNTPGL